MFVSWPAYRLWELPNDVSQNSIRRAVGGDTSKRVITVRVAVTPRATHGIYQLLLNASATLSSQTTADKLPPISPQDFMTIYARSGGNTRILPRNTAGEWVCRTKDPFLR